MTRVRFIKITFLAFGLAIVGRAAQIQLQADPRLERLAKRQFSSKVTALPRRGLIFDRNGDGLAISLKVRSLFFRPELIRKELTRAERQRMIFNVARVLRLPVEQVAAKARSERGFVWVKRHLTAEEEESIRGRATLEYGDAVGLAEETKRFYPNKELAAHVLGTVGVDGQGLEGLELLYEGILTGESVRIASNRDAMGRRIFKDDRGLQAFKDGQSVVLTLDKAIQYEAEKSLAQAMADHQAKAGTVIVAEVETGEILAMANYPTYNPNNPKSASPDARRNRAITDAFEPGSTFKPLLIGYALEKGRSPKTKVYCEKGSFKVGDRRISEAEAHEKYEWLTYGEVLQHSSNIGSAKIALELGAANMSQLIDKLELGRKTEIDLPGEASGSIDRKQLSSAVRLANIGFGHGLTVTPIQMLTYYLALANGGRWIQPKIVKAILSEDPDSLERGSIRWKLGHRFDTLKTRKLFSPQTTTNLTPMLESVVEEGGTGIHAQLAEWPVAGKTGTAQKVDPETKRYSRSKYVANFIGFAPSKNPKLVALVLIDEPQKKYYAGDTAAPVFREIMRASLLRERVEPSDSTARLIGLANRISSKQAALARVSSEERLSATLKPSTPPEQPEHNEKSQIRLPDLRGKTVREALRILGEQPLDVEVVGSGVLDEQTPPAGQWLESGAKVRLSFSDQMK